ncbi:gamma-glutamyl-gamma-aminobutyrate hydrolase family protein [Cryobacterium sp. BB736]|uniref:gamma-glutamyl-gamma-aminobutyrate hydrolase family protein n=1 Tax=Cryobacterium sp. BB736 TaxID=2746963 RepID=UPI001874D354|nr:gamma-glutamyl-gamma-aminobutyrate hydrolase family protein [Cryobacterium sp. BB736]
MTDGAPLIGITMWRRELPTYASDNTDLYTLGVEYVQSLTDAGAQVVLIPDTDVTGAQRLIGTLDGVVIAGGGDVHPENYGGTPSEAERYDRGRDETEIALIRAARVARLPTLGICRGLQIGVVALGGRLIEDIPTTAQHPRGLTGAELLAWRHDVIVEPESTLAGVVGTRTAVNSIHHQAADVVPDGLRIAAVSEDGVIEAVESSTDWDFLAVQWHPEKMHEPAHRRSLFDHFVSVVRAHAKTASHRSV